MPAGAAKMPCGEDALRDLVGGTSSGRHAQTYDTRVQSKIHRLSNLAAARATCQPAAAARRSQARRGAHPTQNAGVHPRPRLRPAHGRLPARVRGRRAVVEDLGVRPPDGGWGGTHGTIQNQKIETQKSL